MDRVASLIREEVGSLLSRDFRGATVGFVTVTEVVMTPDLKIAKIYVSIFGNEKVRKATLEQLEEFKGHVRHAIGTNIRLKFTPSIQFYLDTSLDQVEKINELLKKAHENE
jgi:ribosome-binding factor A